MIDDHDEYGRPGVTNRSDLKLGAVYRLHTRNLEVGVWNGTTFVGIREKFHFRSLDESEVLNVPPGHGTATPFEEVGRVPDGIRLVAHLMQPFCFDCDAEPGPGCHRESHEIDEAAVINRPLMAVLDEIEEPIVEARLDKQAADEVRRLLGLKAKVDADELRDPYELNEWGRGMVQRRLRQLDADDIEAGDIRRAFPDEYDAWANPTETS